jgi:hypothetical protein
MSANEAESNVQRTIEGQHPNPPAGEEIHLPGGSVIPITVAVGVTLMVIGTTVWWVWSLVGFIILVIAVGIWIRDVRHDMAHLPDDLDAGH